MKPLLAFNIGQAVSLNNGATLDGKYQSFGTLVSLVVRNSLSLAGIILFGLIVFGGLSYIISAGSGDAKKTQQAQETLINALIGFAIVFLAYGIIQIIQVVTGLNILNSTL
jgi:ABC-type Na+ efflux pump permease subunit